MSKFNIWDKKTDSKITVDAELVSGNQWKAICPNHDDHDPSLQIDAAKALYKCFVCGYSGQLWDQTKRRVNETDDPGDPADDDDLELALTKPIASYEYKSAGGELLCQAVKYPAPPPKNKTFKQRRPDDKDGWIYNLDGVPLVPYRLPELLIGCDPVFICEGEKDVDNLRALGLTATCNPMGAGKWRSIFNPYFGGRDVIILPDNDLPGKNHARQVAKSLKGIAKGIKIAELPGLPEKGDVSDFLCQTTGITKDVFLERISVLAEEWKGNAKDKYKIISGVELLSMESPEREWLWEGIFPIKGLGLTLGKPKVGKTTFDFNLAVAVSRGKPFLGRATKQGTVLFLALQENEDEVRRSMKRMGGDFSNIHFHFGMAPKEALEELQVEMENRKPVLVVVEMLQNFMRLKEMSDYAETTTKLEPIMDTAQRLECFIQLSHHSPKMERTIVDSALGSTGLLGGVDTGLLIKSDMHDRRSFSTIQRYRNPGVPDIKDMVLTLCNDEITLELGGSLRDECIREVKDQIIEALSNINEETGPLSEPQIREQICKSKNDTLRYLNELYREGRIKRIGSGVRNNPYRYSLERMR